MRRFLPIILCSVTAASCGEAGARATGSEAVPTCAALFDSLGTITLEENQATINVAPIAAPDPAGGFVVVDAKELRGRVYDGSGKLVGAFGRDGKGPGEFTAPMSGRRAPSGELVVADAMEGRITYFDPTGTRATGTSRVPLLPLYDAVPHGDSTLLLVGRAPDGFHAPLLHLFDRRSGTVKRSFFPTPGGVTVQRLAGSLGWADAAVRGDTVAATFGMSDTLYLFGVDGALRRRIPLPFQSFALPEMPEADERTEPRARNDWMQRLTLVYDLFWLPDGSFLVQTGRQKGAELEWGLLHLTPDGERLAELPASPRLMAARGDTLYFVDPRSEIPNRWRIARLRAGM